MSDPAIPSDRKRALRRSLIGARARIGQDERAGASRQILARLEALDLVAGARTLALYAPLGGEVDVLALAERARLAGGRAVFPKVRAGDRRLAFARCTPLDLVRGPLGALEPPEDAPLVEPGEVDCVVLPGVAFSRDGLRLGRGGGYYDATLAAMPRAARVGVAFEVQVVDALPREPHDAALDALVTEARTLRFERESG
ncbi:5-formyltetrahydrofolate cyclo-ligase [Anaeromyxobacter dehalogenans]|uniref:5-formyltetrahydrofolate cyclo-ligase n=1 Tax=Anaeromyxobacter dehalogenans (strain 2CP-C) TaxID=290397 RepID=Q2IPU0_ANADE|nr:5-formyltetrahydrofolate cyclo-ligase [Anaeromyxobacter dehalogenans]ABC80821.1 5-formyltetrahydrofolate cyclo-ligase [Anaeromyxobacter dehalogenans 2CP-C]